MAWIPLTNEEHCTRLVERSKQRPQVIFKHSTRCPLSGMALSRLEKAGFDNRLDFHFLDIIAHRPVSNQVADMFGVCHESPQLLLIRNGECVYDESHMGINMRELMEQI